MINKGNERSLNTRARERWADSLHETEQYYSMALTARYVARNPTDNVGVDAQHIYAALTTLIQRHGALRVGIARNAKRKAFFTHIPQLDLRKHVTFKTLACPGRKEYEAALLELLAAEHDHPWPDQPTTPPWKLIVVQPQVDGWGEGPPKQDFAFFSHHAIMDGTSVRLLQEHFLAALNAVPLSKANGTTAGEHGYILEFPDKAEIPPPREEVIPASLRKRFLTKEMWQYYGPKALKKTPTPVWRGEKVKLNKAVKTRFALMQVPGETVKTLLRACRDHGATVTGLVHALLLASLAQRLTQEEAVSFHSETYIDYRFLPQKNIGDVQKVYGDKLANCFATSYEKHRREAVSAFRAENRDLDALIWSNAQRVTEMIREKRDSLPLDDMVSLIKFIPDLDHEFRSWDGGDRRASWSLSNLVVLGKEKKEAGGEEDETWKIDWAMFHQGAEAAAPAVNVNMVSVADGPLVVNFTWLEGVVPDELVAGVVSDFEKWMAGFAAEGRFSN